MTFSSSTSKEREALSDPPRKEHGEIRSNAPSSLKRRALMLLLFCVLLLCVLLLCLLCLLCCSLLLRRTTRTRRRRGKVEKKWCKRKKSRPFPPRAPHAFCCRCCFLFSPSRREVSRSFLGDRRGNSSWRDCRDLFSPRRRKRNFQENNVSFLIPRGPPRQQQQQEEEQEHQQEQQQEHPPQHHHHEQK